MRMGSPMGAGGGAPSYSSPTSYEAVATQTPEFNTTVYVGNLIPYTTQADLIPLFQGYGYITEIRMQADRGFAFVKLDTHQNAALAITHLQNQLVHGRPIKCSWGKDKAPGDQPGFQVGTAQASPDGSERVWVCLIRTQHVADNALVTTPAAAAADGIPGIPILRRRVWIRTDRCPGTTWSAWPASATGPGRRQWSRWLGRCGAGGVLSAGRLGQLLQ
jgi:hypothetical protein